MHCKKKIKSPNSTLIQYFTDIFTALERIRNDKFVCTYRNVNY